MVTADKILSVGNAITSFDNTLIVKNAYIRATAPNSYGLMVNGASAKVLLDNCQIKAALGAVSIIDNNSTTKIKNTLMVTEGPYSVTTEAGSTPTVRLLAGVCSNKAVDPNVITDPLAPFTVDDNFTITII
jgi:nitrous oxidase accessory protein NosD